MFIINVCNQLRPIVGYVEYHTDANQVYVAPRLLNPWEVLPISRLDYFVPRLQRCLPLGVLAVGFLNSLLGDNPHRHIFTNCQYSPLNLEVIKTRTVFKNEPPGLTRRPDPMINGVRRLAHPSKGHSRSACKCCFPKRYQQNSASCPCRNPEHSPRASCQRLERPDFLSN